MSVRRVAQAELPVVTHSRRFGLMSETLVVETNDAALLAAAEASFGRFPVPDLDRAPLVVQLFKVPVSRADVTHTEPRIARLTHHLSGHLYSISGSVDVASVDGRLGVGVGFVSEETAADTQLVRYAFLEGQALSMLMYGRGYATLHAAGVARDGVGIALCGREGAGKSTLALAAAKRGLDVFAEDGVFIRSGPQGLEFWGMPWTQRIVLDARRFFPELDAVEAIEQPNGEIKLEIDLDEYFPGRARPSAHPAAIVILERMDGGEARLEKADPDTETVGVLWPWGEHWTDAHEEATTLLADLPQYHLTINGSPDAAIDQLELLLEELSAPAIAR